MSDDATTTKAATNGEEMLAQIEASIADGYLDPGGNHRACLLDLFRAARAARAAAEGERKAWAKSIYGIVSFVGDEPRLLTEKQVVRLREIADGLLSAAGDTKEAP